MRNLLLLGTVLGAAVAFAGAEEWLQPAIDAAAAKGGGRVVVPAGDHACKSIRLRSNVELHLAKGARLVGSTNSADYVSFPDEICAIHPEKSTKVFIYGWDLENVAITGEGVIDGEGPKFFDRNTVLWQYFWAKPACERPRMVQLVNCRGIRFEGVTFKDSPCWTMLIKKCENILFDRIKVRADLHIVNSDGVDFDTCRHVRVRNCEFSTGDDCFAIRAIRDPGSDRRAICEDIEIADCELESNCQTVRFGCPSDDEIRNVTVRNIRGKGGYCINFDYPAHYLSPRDEGFLDIHDILIENYVGSARHVGLRINAEPGVKLRSVRNILFRDVNITCKKPASFVSNVFTKMENIRYERVTFNGQRMPDGVVEVDATNAQPLKRADGHSWETDEQGKGRPQPAVKSAAVDETAVWQQKIDAAAARGGGTVEVTPGRHEVGQLNLRSNVELKIAEGAALVGAFGLQHYGILSLPYSEGTWSAVVMAVGCTNVAVTGKGTIDGRGDLWPQPNPYLRNQEGHRPRGLVFADCAQVRLEDFTLRDAACWGIVIKRCDGVAARRVKIDNHANLNNDGFDIEGRNVLIEECEVDSGDDAYCFKANDPEFKGGNIVVRNCLGRSHSTCYKLGTGTHGTLRGLRIENCRALRPRRDFICRQSGPKYGKPFFYREEFVREFPQGIGKTALSLQNCDGGDIGDIVVDGLEFEDYVVPFTIRGADRLIRPPRIPPNTLKRFGNLVLRNIRGRTASSDAAWICGVDGLRVKGVRLENVEVELAGSGAKVRPTVEQTPATDHNPPGYTLFHKQLVPAYGLYIDKADDVELVNVNFRLKPGTADFRPAIFDSASPEGIPGLISPNPERDLYQMPEWRRRFRTLKSSADRSRQPFYWYDPEVQGKVPLVVAFHSWGASCHWSSPALTVQQYCAKRGWAMVYPNFRGPNVRPEGCGSDLACQDTLDVIEWAQKERAIDADRIYLIGGSGGGYFTLLMGGRFPEIFAGAAAFCPISDLSRWYYEAPNHYPKNVATACGGNPAECPFEYGKRSPLTYLNNARVNRLPFYIVTGIHDGHRGASVPVGHSLRAFNALADGPSRFSEAEIAKLEQTEKVDASMAFSGSDPFYGQHTPIHLRRTSANARLTVFEAGHAGNYAAGLDFLSRQCRGRAADMSLPAAAEAGKAVVIPK